ncbi:glycosyltransferase family 4 protein [Salinisphaera orenii]|uniref:glycosyltransferase family 4 protein n=1 Tax=Salinisphaera orenii TaxID=856731 RepID=UPI000DBE7B97
MGQTNYSVAVVCDWLTVYAGAERVIEQLLVLYPAADLFSVCDFIPDEERGFLQGHNPQTTFIQKLPGARKRYRSYLPFMPIAIEQLDLSGYDLVISSSHAVAKGVLTGPDQLHVSYVHSPIRYAWDLQHQYLRESGMDRGLKGMLARYCLHRMRLWDTRTANGVDAFAANSNYIRRRIAKAYRREATCIYPPVDVSAFSQCNDKDDYFLTTSRLAPYKRIDLIVQAFTKMPDKTLKVIGDGPEMPKLKHLAAGHSNIELLGYQPFEVLRTTMQSARAFIFAAEEDFGIVPVEAQACGTPVIAYNRGGTAETIRGLDTDAPTGVLFDTQSAACIQGAVEMFDSDSEQFKPDVCRENALQFSADVFQERFKQFVDEAAATFYQRP